MKSHQQDTPVNTALANESDIDAQAMITIPQWRHLDGHVYDIERTQSRLRSNEQTATIITRWKILKEKDLNAMFVNVVEFFSTKQLRSFTLHAW
jgi:hypothetical protein